MALNREQKGELAAQVIRQVGNLVEFWNEHEDDLPEGHPLKNVALAEIRDQVATWMAKLPGDAWDVRLGSAGK
jgi:hypothetical protein